jgi:hypothetical protein
LWKDVETFVQKAKEGSSWCCGDDLMDCKCPKVDMPDFRNKIGAWCQGIQACFPCQGNKCEGPEEPTTIEVLLLQLQEEEELLVAVLPEDHP